MSNARLDQFTRFESCLKWAHINAPINLEKTYVSDCFSAVDITSTDIHVGETAADYVFFLATVCLAVTFQPILVFLLVCGRTLQIILVVRLVPPSFILLIGVLLIVVLGRLFGDLVVKSRIFVIRIALCVI